MEKTVVDVDKFNRRWCIIWFVFGYVANNLMRSIIVNQTSTFTFCGQKVQQKFNSAWFSCLTMSISMVLVYPVYLIKKLFKKNQNVAEVKVQTDAWLKIPICGFLDIFHVWSLLKMISYNGVGLGSILLALNVTIIIVWKRFFLHKQIKLYMWVSTLIIILSIALVFIMEYLSSTSTFNGSTKDIFLLICGFIGQICNSISSIIEEDILHNTDMQPEVYTATFGLCDLLITLFIGFPISYFINDPEWMNFYENMCQCFEMLGNNRSLIFSLFGYIITSTIMNISISYMIYYTSALHCAVYSGFAAAILWVIGLLIGIFATGSPIMSLISQDWDNKVGWVIVVCYIFFVIGLLLFSQVIKIPCFKYEEESVYVVPMEPSDE